MMDKIERLIVGVELIAESLSHMAKAAGVSAPAVAPAPAPDKSTVVVAPAPVVYPPDNDRDAWLIMCKDRFIDVPKGTKTPTLIKQVKAWDAAHAGDAAQSAGDGAIENPPQASTDSLGSENAGASAEVDPFGQDNEPDPFGTRGAPEPEPITLDTVRAALQVVQKERGNPAVVEILLNAAGVERIKDLTEDKYDAVLKAAS